MNPPYLSDRDYKFSGHEERDRLMYWYVHAAMWGRFAGSTETVLAQDLTAVIEGGERGIDRLVANLRQQRGELRVNPGDFHGWSRGARFFSILYMLTRVNGGRDWGSGERLDKHMLGRYTDLELHHIFPKHVLYAAEYSRPEVNALANFAFLTLETNRDISATPPTDYFPRYLAQHPGAVESHWVPTDPELWRTEEYPRFAERRRTLLASALNDFLDALWAGGAAEAAEELDVATTVQPELREPAADEETTVLDELQEWVASAGFDSGVRDYELADPAGEAVAVLDLAWPRGLQVELSEPVTLLINEPAEVREAATEHGYRVFTSSEQLRQYAEDLLVRAGDPAEELTSPAL